MMAVAKLGNAGLVVLLGGEEEAQEWLDGGGITWRGELHDGGTNGMRRSDMRTRRAMRLILLAGDVSGEMSLSP